MTKIICNPIIAKEDIIGLLNNLPSTDLQALLLQHQIQIAQEIGAKYCRLFLYNEENQSLWTISQYNDSIKKSWVTLEQGIFGEVMSTGKTVNITNMTQYANFNQEDDELVNVQIYNLLCLPLCTPDQKRIGVVQVFNKASAFTHLDEKKLAFSSCHLAVVIENARRCQEIRTLSQTLQNDHHQLQAAYHQLKNDKLKLESKLKTIKLRRKLIAVVLSIVVFSVSWIFWLDKLAT
jgi:transcriptional regulator with GAF, ATPase, and Fis domain